MKPSVLIGMPLQRGQIETESFLTLLAIRADLYRRDINHHIITNESSVISYSRNAIAERCCHDYLMWIDSDIKAPPWGVWRLMSRDKDIIGGLYFRKEKDARPLIFRLNENNFFETITEIPSLKEPFRVDGIATGFLLIKRHVLEAFTPEVCQKLYYPFDMGRGPSNHEEGEDLSFMRRVKALGFEVWCDPTIPLGHVGRHIYTREDWETFNQMKTWTKNKFHYTNDIDGWMGQMELAWLYETAKEMNSIVEVGSWKGRSTHALLSGCPGTVYAVDHWKGSPSEKEAHAEARERDIFEDFLKNVGHFQNLVVMRGDSVNVAKTFADKSVDMVFIDGGHTYKAVKADIEAWLPKARKMICGHDYNFHGVQEAVTEIFGDVDTAENIWVVKL